MLAASFVDGLGEFLTEEAAINCGTSVESVQAAVAKFMAMTDEEKQAMRDAGRKLAQQYSWEACAGKIGETWNGVLQAETTD